MNKKRCLLIIFILIVSILLLVFVNLMTGSLRISPKRAVEILMDRSKDATGFNVLYNIRLPRIIYAIVLGGALALSGYLLQTFFNNPIVGPFVLGISSGAKLAVALTLIFFMSRGVLIGSGAMVFAAFIGAMVVMGFVLIVSLKVNKPGLLVVCGIMVGYICSAVTDLTVTFADDSNIVNLHNWSMGSLSGANWQDVRIMCIVTGCCLVVTFGISKPVGAYRLGEAYARNMGVNIPVLRVMLILISGLLAAVVTAFAGPISFVGIAVPHLLKLGLKTSSPIVMIPGCFLGGAAVTLLCDGIARSIFSPVEVSISSVTAVILVPVVIAMLMRKSS